MNPIELGKAIAEYGTPIITAVMLILVVGLVWYLIKRQAKREDKHDTIQSEERLFYRNLVVNDLKSLHEDGAKNAELNAQSIVLQKDMMRELKDCNEHNSNFQEKTIESLNLICDRLNDGNATMKIAKKKLNEEEK